MVQPDVQPELNQQEKLTLLLEKMQFSKGFIEFKRTCGAANILNNSILPQTSILKQSPTKTSIYQSFLNDCLDPNKNILESFAEDFGNNTQSSIHPSPRKPRALSPLLSAFGAGYTAYHSRGLESEPSPTRGRSLELKESTQHVFQHHLENLKEIFLGYCSLMSSGKDGYVMRATDLANLLKDAGLLEAEQIRSKSRGVSPSQTHRERLETSPRPSQREGGLIKRLELDLYLRKILVTRNQEQTDSSPQRPKSPSITQRKITFEVFLKVIEYVAIFMNPKTREEEAVKHVIAYYLESLINGGKVSISGNDVRDQFKSLIKMLKDPALVDVLAFLKKQFHSFYQKYCFHQNNQINFTGFMKFCRDFALFPTLMSRNKLIKTFYSLASLYPLINNRKDRDESGNGLVSQRGGRLDVIDENLFVQSFAICAGEIISDDQQSHMVNKVYNLLEKMTDALIPRQIGASPEIALGLGKNEAVIGQALSWIKSKYPELSQSLEKSRNKDFKKVQKFEELFSESVTETSLLD